MIIIQLLKKLPDGVKGNSCKTIPDKIKDFAIYMLLGSLLKMHISEYFTKLIEAYKNINTKNMIPIKPSSDKCSK